MKKITPKYRPYLERAPRFLEAVQQAKQGRADTTVQETLETFEDDPFLLYACLWHAYSEGVAVTFQVPKRR